MVKNSVKAKNKSPLLNKHNIFLYNRQGETRIFLFLAFIIPFLIIWFFFSKNEIHPFGDKQILVTDLWHQYYPFFRLEHEKLQEMSSLLYSWETGLGTNFISLMSYYAASPLNFLAVFFPIEYSREALTLFLTLKISFAGLFFAIFVKHVFKKNDFSIVAFGLCYALCDFVMGYYWNVIWMDTFALLPLVVLGTVKLFTEGKYKLYVISLALSLISSFYIGLFTCIFTFMVFLALAVIDWKGFKNLGKRLLQTAGCTVIAVGMGAVILLPAFLGLMLTNSADNTFPTEMSFYEPWLKMISSIIGFHEPTAKEGLPNFYCGMFAVILLGVFIRSRKIKIREKIITVLYLAFIIVSCNMNILNYMWHGFHFTNMLPYRFSFLLSFILLGAGYRAYTVLKEEKNIFDMLALAIMTVVVALISYRDQTEKALISSVVVCLVLTALITVFELKLINEKVLNIAVLAVCIVEMGMNVSIGVKTVSVTTYSIYPRDNEAITALVEDIEKNDDGLYRVETTSEYTLNDPALYGYNGISQFSSTANVSVTNFTRNLGLLGSAAGNRYYYNQNTPIVNMFLSLKYIMSVDSYSGDLTYLEPMSNMDGVAVYKNNYWLPIGFTAENILMDYTGEEATQFENQNELFKLATGIDKDVLEKIEVRDSGHQGVNVIKSAYGVYNYQRSASEEGTDSYLKFNYEIPHDGPVYVTFDFGEIKNLKIKRDTTILTSHNTGKYINTFAAGDFLAGETLTIQANVSEEQTNGNGKIFVYQINDEVFKEGYQKLSDGGLNVTSHDDTHIKGTITAENDCIMYTSIPYDGGWKVYIDGKETETVSLLGAFTCVPISAGEHEVEMKYSPPGFVAGLAITGASVAVFVLLWVFGFRRAKKKNNPLTLDENQQQPLKTAESSKENTDGAEKP